MSIFMWRLTGTRSGGVFTDDLSDGAGTPVAITTSIATRQVFQRGRSVITLAGTYDLSGTPAGMAWRVGAGDWVQFASETIGGGAWSGTLAIPSDYVGQGTLEVKPINGLSVTPATRANITVSDVWVINGQSNSDGSATNDQTYTKTNFDLVVAKSNNSWQVLTGDPVGASGGSIFPALAELIDAAGVPPVFVTGARVNGTGFADNDWNPPSDGAYLTSIANMQAALSKTGGCAGEIWIQGENDAIAEMATQDYIDAWIARREATEAAVSNFDSSTPSYISQIGEVATASAAGLNQIRAALLHLGSGVESAAYRYGPNILTEQYGDGTHYGVVAGNIDTAEAEAQLDRIAAYWYRSLYGSDRSAPAVTGYSVGTGADADKITVTFDRAMENHSRADEWTVADGEGARTVTGAAQGASSAQVVLTCDQALYGSVTVSFGSGLTAEVAIEDVAAQLREATAINNVKYPPQFVLSAAAGTGVGAIPALTSAPTLGGSTSVGGEITATDGVYSGVPNPTVGAYQWQVSDDGVTGWADISGATGATYTIQAGDDGKYLRRGEVATNAVGSAARAYTAASGQISDIATPVGIFNGDLLIWTTSDNGVFEEIASESTAADGIGDPVGTWRDRSANGNHLRATATGSRGTVQANGIRLASGQKFIFTSSGSGNLDLSSQRILLGFAYVANGQNWIAHGRDGGTSGWAGIGQSGNTSTTLASLSVLNGEWHDGATVSGNRDARFTSSQSAVTAIFDISNHVTVTDPALGSILSGFGSIGDLKAVVVASLSGAPTQQQIDDLHAYLASL